MHSILEQHAIIHGAMLHAMPLRMAPNQFNTNARSLPHPPSFNPFYLLEDVCVGDDTYLSSFVCSCRLRRSFSPWPSGRG
jgi:hypothetical protein